MCVPRSLDAGPSDPWIEIALSIALNAVVGRDHDQETILCRRCQARVEIVGDQDMTGDIGNLHMPAPSLGSRPKTNPETDVSGTSIGRQGIRRCPAGLLLLCCLDFIPDLYPTVEILDGSKPNQLVGIVKPGAFIGRVTVTLEIRHGRPVCPFR